MTGIRIDGFAERAADAFTRRRSVLALGVAALGAVAQRGGADAGSCGKKVKSKCAEQVKQCKAGVAEVCAEKGGDLTLCIACEECCVRAGGVCVNKSNFACLLGCFDLLDI